MNTLGLPGLPSFAVNTLRHLLSPPLKTSAQPVSNAGAIDRLLGNFISNEKTPAASPLLGDSVKLLNLQSKLYSQVIRVELLSKVAESASSAVRRLSQNGS